MPPMNALTTGTVSASSASNTLMKFPAPPAGSHLYTHDAGGAGGRLSSLSLSREEVESGCEKLLGSRIRSM